MMLGKPAAKKYAEQRASNTERKAIQLIGIGVTVHFLP
jgi:hypothetical protein